MCKKAKTKALALLLALVMVVGLLPATAFAAETDEFTVVVSMEGLTLGQGMYVEPKAYTLDEINNLISQEGYGPYTAEDMPASMATLAMVIDAGLEIDMTGTWDSNFYLSQVKDIDSGTIDIPAIIGENGGPTNDANDGNSDEWLGEYDYSSMAGWMIAVNNNLLPVGAADYILQEYRDQGIGENYGDLYVVRWMFSCYSFGADLGFDSGWGSSPMFTAANKDALYTEYAMSSDAQKKAAALEVMENLTATQENVDAATATLQNNGGGTEPDVSQDVSTVLNDTMAQMAATVTAPVFGTTAGEWSVLSLARGGYYAKDNAYFTDYYDRIVETVNTKASSVNLNGALHKVKSTENSRLILALSSIGKDATSVGDWNLIAPFEDFTWITKQGINGPAFALIALDTHNYQTTDTTIRQQCIDYLLGKQLADGGWALSGTTADPDVTSMVLQALENYSDQAAVAAAAEKGFTALSNIQKDDGGYASWGTVNCESIAQVITACTAWGINPDTDTRFVKSGGSAVDAILRFYLADSHSFCHEADGVSNAIATDQACYALVAYQRFLNGQTSLYDMSDVTFGGSDAENDTMTAILGLPAKVESAPGTAFQATVSLDRWDNEAGYKLIDFIMAIPEGLSVTGVTPSDRLSGGEISYHVEPETGKLRVVYFDANENASLQISGTDFPAEVFTISFAVDGATAGTTLPVAITGMSVKLTSDSSDENAMIIVNTDTANGSVQVVQGISFSAVMLYQGDDVDLIPATKKAVAVSVTGIAAEAKLQYNDGTNEISFLYSPEISQKTGVSSYVALVDASIDMANFIKADYFSISGTGSEKIAFGDANDDGVINAQDALAAVDTWLRKTEEPTDIQILTLNVNSDSRINTFDALGIVEVFVNGGDYTVVTRASQLATTP